MKEKLKHIFLVLTSSEKRQFWIQVFLNFVISLADIAMLALLLFVISFYIGTSSQNLLGLLPEWMRDKNSVSLILFFFLLFTGKNLLGIVVSNTQFKYISDVATRLSKQKLDNYLNGNFEQFIKIDSSEHIRKIAFQPFEFCQHVLLNLQQIIIQACLILLTMIAILIFNAQLFFLLILLLLPPVIFVFFFIKKKSITIKKTIHSANEFSFRYLLDAIKGYAESNIYDRNDFFIERFATKRKEFSRSLFSSLSYQAMPQRIIETFAVLGLFILIVMIKLSGNSDSSILITMGAFIAGAYKIIPGIVKIVNAAGQIKAYDLTMEDHKTNGMKNELFNHAETKPIYSIQLKNIWFNYNGTEVFKDFSFCIRKGDFIGLRGRSGAGKTTILNLLLGFSAPAKGNVIINNEIVTPSSLKKYWPQISYVRQQSFFIYDTVLKNITLGNDAYDLDRMNEIVGITGISEFIGLSQDRFEKIIYENGKNISGGQQQRIAIARALYKDPSILILDEPFNELDDNSATVLAQHFRKLADGGKTIILITHDENCLSCCNKVISIDEQAA